MILHKIATNILGLWFERWDVILIGLVTFWFREGFMDG